MTAIGKMMVFVIVMISLAALGVAIWIGIDKRDWKGQLEAVNQDILRRDAARQKEEEALRLLLIELNRGERAMPLDVAALHGGQGAGGAALTVSKAKEENKRLKTENDDRLNEANKLQVQFNALLDDVKKARDTTLAAEAEQKALREMIKPDPDLMPNQKPIRDIIADHRAAKDGAEVQQERVKPELLNELVKVAQLLERNAELQSRLNQLKAAKSSAQARP